MLCLTFFTAGFAAGVAAGGVVVAWALAFIASELARVDLVLADLFDDLFGILFNDLADVEVESDAFTLAELAVTGVVLVDLLWAARAGAVNSEAASKAAEICFNMGVLLVPSRRSGKCSSRSSCTHHGPAALNRR